MQLGMVGLGRMGANMVRRLLKGGHQCVVYDVNPSSVTAMIQEGAEGRTSLKDFIEALEKPRAIWMMVPAAVVDQTMNDLLPLMDEGDILIDGGNSNYVDGIHRAERCAEAGITFLDVGTSGGVWGLERGYCLMIGGEKKAVEHLRPIFRSLAPGPSNDDVSADSDRTELMGFLHCGPAGAGHFVKMVHNGIEYGLMAAYSEGFNILKRADIGNHEHEISAESTPLRNPEYFKYEFDLPAISELWRRGSVVSSWLLDLTAKALADSPDLGKFTGKVSDSGEGRWTVSAAIDQGTPAPVLSAALFQRFSSRGEDEFACKLLSAMRYQFGGHQEKK